MRGVNLTRFTEASVDFVEEKDRVPALKTRAMASNIGGTTLRAAVIAPSTRLELAARHDCTASIALITNRSSHT